jgi:hypothetical protein
MLQHPLRLRPWHRHWQSIRCGALMVACVRCRALEDHIYNGRCIQYSHRFECGCQIRPPCARPNASIGVHLEATPRNRHMQVAPGNVVRIFSATGPVLRYATMPCDVVSCPQGLLAGTSGETPARITARRLRVVSLGRPPPSRRPYEL